MERELPGAPKAYYNEIDPYAAEWLRSLIFHGLIAEGDVDERSIVDVKADDLEGYTQCHFFAGIGVWSLALRNAGWRDDEKVWTGSCPCQPFSAAGKQKGTADARHLWPAWFRLIKECHPGVVFGEQVAAAIRQGWLDLVSTDLESLDYAIGSAVLGAHSVGAPHIRQRLYFVADADEGRRWQRRKRRGLLSELPPERADEPLSPTKRSSTSELADSDGGQSGDGDIQRGGEHGLVTQDGGADWLEHAQSDRRIERRAESGGRGAAERCCESSAEFAEGKQMGIPGRARIARSADFWSACDWLPCIDGKARPVEPGTFPLVNGAPARVGRLRAYGNAIVAPLAKEFIAAYLESR